MNQDNDSTSDDRLNEILAEYLQAIDAGQSLDEEQLIEQHPKFAEQLREFFADKRRVDQIAKPAAPEDQVSPRALPSEMPTIPPTKRMREAETLPPGNDPQLPVPNKQALIGTRIRYFGDYELLEEIARGGMGVVYKARQVKLNRVVAIKMILAGQLASQEDVQRFYTEAEAAAGLDHPGIVPIFEVGEHEGQHYFSMGFVDGESLSSRLAVGPLPPREAAELVRKVAEAVQYAHDQGVIHRDLKPANVLLQAGGGRPEVGGGTIRSGSSLQSPVSSLQPKVTDFGLAKKTAADSNLTGTGQILGTPSYMPPEQAAGRLNQVRETADVYSLGAILYATLTARPPFQADNPLDTLLQVLEREPISPRQLNPNVPRDLEIICLKCLEKERRRRYDTARSLGDELQRFLNGEPIHARPIGRVARGWRWCKRNPVVASLIATVALSLIAGTAISAYFAVEAGNRAVGENTQRQLAQQRASEAIEQRDAATRALEQSRRGMYALQLMLVANVCEREPLQGRTLLEDTTRCPDDLRDFTWGYYYRLCQRDRVVVRPAEGVMAALRFQPDDQALVTVVSMEKTVTVQRWDAATGRELRTFVLQHEFGWERNIALSDDGSTIAVWGRQQTSGWRVQLWNATTGEPLPPVNGSGELLRCALRSNGRTIITWNTRPETGWLVCGWNTASGEQNFKSEGAGELVSAELAKGAELVATRSKILDGANETSAIQLWDINTGRERKRFDVSQTGPPEFAISPAGQTIAVKVNAAEPPGLCQVQIMNVAEDSPAVTLEGRFQPGPSLVFSPDGKTLAIGFSLWDVVSGKERVKLTGPRPESTAAVEFSPDGSLIAIAALEQMWNRSDPKREVVRLFDAATGIERATFRRAGWPLPLLAFSTDGQSLAHSRKGDPVVRICQTSLQRERLRISAHPTGVDSVVFSPDGKTLTTSRRREWKSWDAATGLNLAETEKLVENERKQIPDGFELLASSADGRTLLLLAADKTRRLWDALGKRELGTIDGNGRTGIGAVVFSIDGKTMAVRGGDSIRIWNATDGSERSTIDIDDGTNLFGFAISSDGTNIAVGTQQRIMSGRKVVTMWDTATGKPRFVIEEDGLVNSFVFSADGRTLVTGSDDGWVKLWDSLTGNERAVLSPEQGNVTAVAFSPNGRTLATGGKDGTVKLWEAAGWNQQ